MTIEIHNCRTDQTRLMSFNAAFQFWLMECGYSVYPKEEHESIKSSFQAAVSSNYGAVYYPYTISRVYEGPLVNPDSNTRHLN